MKHLLIATDFSSCADNAMEYALNLAKVFNSEVTVLHTISPAAGIDNSLYNAFFIEDYLEVKRKALNEWIEKFSSNEAFKDIKLNPVSDVGFLTDIITIQNESKPIDLIVMGTTGATGVKGLLGSNASSVATNVEIPALLLPMDVKFKALPNISLAADFSTEFTPRILETLKGFVAGLGSKKMSVVNVVVDKDFKPSDKDENEMKAKFEGLELDFHYVEDFEPAAAINHFVESTDTDILCTIKHHHGLLYKMFYGSQSAKLMKKIVKGVLVLHD